jgi:inosine-uridine nucleoside N-ribohydrolase
LFWSEKLFAQSPQHFRIPLVDLPNIESSEAEVEAENATTPDHGRNPRNPRPVIVDTDPGIDDAVALIWLLSQQKYPVDVRGIVGVSGNTNVAQTVVNISMILEWVGREDIPVVQGAAQPFVQAPSLTQALIHGPDGLWGTSIIMPPQNGSPDFSDATAFYCNNLTRETMVIALGPLTTIANALEAAETQCPDKWNGVELVSLGGAIHDGNQTPVTEYNYWQDPEAVEKVLSLAAERGVTIKIVLADAFRQFVISPSDIRQLVRRGNEAIFNLVNPELPIPPALPTYMFVLAGGDTTELPDPAAVIYALDNKLGTTTRGLVDVISEPEPWNPTELVIPEVVRGQTVVGLNFAQITSMVLSDAELSAIAAAFIADPTFDVIGAVGALLATKVTDNAFIVTDIDARRMHNIFMQGLREGIFSTSVSSDQIEQGDYDNHLFVPQVTK